MKSCVTTLLAKLLLQDDNIYNDKDITQLLKKPLVQLNDIKQMEEKYYINRDVVTRRMLDANNSYDRLNSDLKESRKSEVVKKLLAVERIHIYIQLLIDLVCILQDVYQGYSSGYIQRYDLHHCLKRKDQYCVQILDAVSKRLKKWLIVMAKNHNLIIITTEKDDPKKR